MKPYRPVPDPHPIREKFAVARKELSSALIEREEEVDLVLTALLAGEHVLLVGPPGSAKSLLLDSLLSWTGGAKFSILFTKFTTPEEVLGPDDHARRGRGRTAGGPGNPVVGGGEGSPRGGVE